MSNSIDDLFAEMGEYSEGDQSLPGVEKPSFPGGNSASETQHREPEPHNEGSGMTFTPVLSGTAPRAEVPEPTTAPSVTTPEPVAVSAPTPAAPQRDSGEHVETGTRGRKFYSMDDIHTIVGAYRKVEQLTETQKQLAFSLVGNPNGESQDIGEVLVSKILSGDIAGLDVAYKLIELSELDPVERAFKVASIGRPEYVFALAHMINKNTNAPEINTNSLTDSQKGIAYHADKIGAQFAEDLRQVKETLEVE